MIISNLEPEQAQAVRNDFEDRLPILALLVWQLAVLPCWCILHHLLLLSPALSEVQQCLCLVLKRAVHTSTANEHGQGIVLGGREGDAIDYAGRIMRMHARCMHTCAVQHETHLCGFMPVLPAVQSS